MILIVSEAKHYSDCLLLQIVCVLKIGTLCLILFSRYFSQFSTLCGQHFSSRCGREIPRHLPTNGVQLAQMISKKLDLRITVNWGEIRYISSNETSRKKNVCLRLLSESNNLQTVRE